MTIGGGGAAVSGFSSSAAVLTAAPLEERARLVGQPALPVGLGRSVVAARDRDERSLRVVAHVGRLVGESVDELGEHLRLVRAEERLKLARGVDARTS